MSETNLKVSDLTQLQLVIEEDATDGTFIVYYKDQIINAFEKEKDAYYCVRQLQDFFHIGFINGACSQVQDKEGTKEVLIKLGVDYNHYFGE